MPCGSKSSCPLTLMNALTTSDNSFNITNGPTAASPYNITTLPDRSWNSSSSQLDNVTAPYTVSNRTHNVTFVPIQKIPHLDLSLIMFFSVLTTACNLIVLTASKFATGGKSPTLVFIRSLCVSDSLIGVYGMFKVALYMCVDQLLMNFFLAESLFFTASFASGLSLLSLNIDCCMKLAEPLNYSNHVDKKNVITIMVMLWNLSFIGGFLPQMGWRVTNGRFHILRFFIFHPWHYLLFFSLILIVIFVMNIVITVYMKNKITLIQSHRSFLSPTSSKFQKYHTLVITAGIDMVLWILCYLPFFIYLAVYCDVCFKKGAPSAERNIVYFIPVFLAKSFISGIVHGYRTAQIHAVMKKFSRSFSRIVQTSRKRRRKGQQVTSNGRNNNNSMRSTEIDLTEIDTGNTLSSSTSGDSDRIEVISSQVTLYSNAQSADDVDIINPVVTRL